MVSVEDFDRTKLRFSRGFGHVVDMLDLLLFYDIYDYSYVGILLLCLVT